MASSSSTEYLPQTLTFLIANFQSFISIKLDSSNYFAWKTQVETALRANSLFEFATGSHIVPSVETLDSAGNKIPNPDYVKWDIVDRMLLSCLIGTLTPSILPHILGAHHTCEVCSKLEEKFSSLSRTHVMDLKRRLYTVKKTTPMELYLDTIKGLLQKLEASGTHIDNEDVVFHTLNGLPDETYRTFKQAIRTRAEVTPLTFSALYSMLMAEDLCQDTTLDTSTLLVAQHTPGPLSHIALPSSGNTPTISTAGSTAGGSGSVFQMPVQFGQQGPQFAQPSSMGQGGSQSGYSNNGGYRGYKGNRFRGSRNNWNNNNNSSSDSCQICGKNNHQANRCHFRQDLNYRPPSSQSSSYYGASFGANVHVYSQYPTQNMPQQVYPTGFSSPRPQAFMVNTDGSYSASLGSYSAPPSYPAYPPTQTPWSVGSQHTAYATPVMGPAIASTQTPWFFDSGATTHVTNNPAHISTPSYHTPSTVTVGNGQSIPVSTSGKGLLPLPTQNFYLNHILHVPQISHNLLYVHKFALDNNCRLIFYSYGYVIQDITTNLILHKGPCHQGLYPLLPSSELQSTATALLSLSSSAELWHRRLGHPHGALLQHLSTKYNLAIPSSVNPLSCYACNKGKSHRLSFPTSVTYTLSPFELIHADVWGPAPIASFSGYKYYLLLVDDFTRYSWLFPLHFKSDVASHIQAFRAFVSNHFNTSIKTIRSDCGGEFLNKLMTAFFCSIWYTSRNLLSLHPTTKWLGREKTCSYCRNSNYITSTS